MDVMREQQHVRKGALVQGQDVISIVSSPEVSVTVLNVTNAVLSGTGAAGNASMTNLTTATSIPRGSYGNFTVILNATSQVASA